MGRQIKLSPDFTFTLMEGMCGNDVLYIHSLASRQGFGICDVQQIVLPIGFYSAGKDESGITSWLRSELEESDFCVKHAARSARKRRIYCRLFLVDAI